MIHGLPAFRANAKENATHLIQNSKDVVNQEINVEAHKAVYLVNCENCTYTVKGKLVKLTVENCRNVVLKVEDKILTGTVDLFKSTNVSLHFERSVSMFSLENNQSIDIRLPDAEHFGYMIWAGVEDLKLRLGDDVHVLSYSELQSRNPGLRPETDQFKTSVVDGSIMTEAMIRLDGGFPATRTEEANHRQVERFKDEVLRGGHGGEEDEENTEGAA
ncbi:hypothetical protein BGZ65_009141 [Modicella reniformis]|uniref:C-CAP/cofactor C-like domain-containing protein n=1 Tax=Modicella reniformis TaxID=1440133 RepID=A0A9P6M7E3_9FUNG|nr:hypothetical protein BGZ65_009141 [Modicella reniformis]